MVTVKGESETHVVQDRKDKKEDRFLRPRPRSAQMGSHVSVSAQDLRALSCPSPKPLGALLHEGTIIYLTKLLVMVCNSLFLQTEAEMNILGHRSLVV